MYRLVLSFQHFFLNGHGMKEKNWKWKKEREAVRKKYRVHNIKSHKKEIRS